MKNIKLTFENLYENFKNIFPQYRDFFQNKEKSNLVDENDGAHISFAFCVVPFIFKLVDEGKNDELKKAFEYIEFMASSKDPLISEVVAFTILEKICVDEKYFSYLSVYFGKNTMKLIPLVKQFVKLDNLN